MLHSVMKILRAICKEKQYCIPNDNYKVDFLNGDGNNYVDIEVAQGAGDDDVDGCGGKRKLTVMMKQMVMFVMILMMVLLLMVILILMVLMLISIMLMVVMMRKTNSVDDPYGGSCNSNGGGFDMKAGDEVDGGNYQTESIACYFV